MRETWARCWRFRGEAKPVSLSLAQPAASRPDTEDCTVWGAGCAGAGVGEAEETVDGGLHRGRHGPGRGGGAFRLARGVSSGPFSSARYERRSHTKRRCELSNTRRVNQPLTDRTKKNIVVVLFALYNGRCLGRVDGAARPQPAKRNNSYFLVKDSAK